MAVTEIPWNDGTGGKIYLTYSSASGDQTVAVTSDANTGAARTKTVTFTSGVGSITRQLTVSQEAGAVEPTPNHACITFRSDGTNTIAMTCNGTSSPTIYYSTDGTTWAQWDYSAITITPGHPVFMYGSNSSRFSSSSSNYSQFVMGGTGQVTCLGNLMVMVDGTGTTTTIPYSYYFYALFMGCTVLKSAPGLPATTLKSFCYYSMFQGCTALVDAPALPATTLQESCYRSMFYQCSSLETAPTLPATTLVRYCYHVMFRYCSKLNYVKAMFTTTPGSSYTSNWLGSVASSGTFVKNSAASWTNTGASAVPSSWTIQTASS